MTSPPPPPEDTEPLWPVVDDGSPVTDEVTVVSTQQAAPDPPLPPDRGIGAGMLLGLGVLALVAAAIVIAYLLTHRDHTNKQTTTVVVVSTPTATKVLVPRVTGQPLAAAESSLRSAGLAFTEAQVSSKQPAGTVVGQQPDAGTEIAKGSTVTLSVARASSGTASTTTAPNTTTSTATTTTTTTTTPEPTTTAAVTPPAPKNATVPDLSGMSEQAAVNAANRAGILPSLFFVLGTDPLGTVEQQAKPSGTVVAYHSHVQLNVSKGPNATTDVTVPNAIGQTLTQAVSTMNGAKLRLIYVKFPVTTRAQAGKIVQQSPLAGGQAPQNAQVLVFLAAFKG